MRNASLLRIALIGLLLIVVLCIVGIVWLASANPARQIPDILVGTTTLAVGAVIGILVPTNNKGA